MSHAAITVDSLSKAYRIGRKSDAPDTLVGAFTGVLKAPWRNWRRLSRLNTFSHPNGEEADDIIWAVRDVSFDVEQGEVLGIIGRNGAGKSTLLKILSRITEPTAGRAIIRGRVSSLLEVGTGFHHELTGRENVYMNGTILGMTKREIDRKFDEIVDFSGVEKFLDTPIKYYSSGMKVRLAFAVAANLEPEILIIDEVLAVGDAEFQKKCLGKMKDVAHGGRTVLFVSHNMAALETMCHRGMYLANGRKALAGPITDVVTNYRKHVLSASETARHFDGNRFLRRMEIFDSLGHATSAIPIGQNVRLRAAIESDELVAFPRIFIYIDDLLGHRLMTFQPPLNDNPIEQIEGKLTVDCVIHEFPLAPGHYTISFVLMDSRQVLEYVPDCGTINVVNAPLFDEGRGFGLGMCAARSSWSVLAPHSPSATIESNNGAIRSS